MEEVAPSVFVVLPVEEQAVLSAVGVSAAVLKAAALVGEQARDRCTANHPLSMPGFVAWGDAMRSLRDQLIPLKWTARNRMNYPMVVSPGGETAISVASGGAGTGDPMFRNPTTKRPKGMVTQDVVLANQLSLPVPGVQPIRKRTVETTWLLLVDRRPGPQGDIIYSEISRPYSMEGKWIVAWKPRIILPPIDYSTVPNPGRDRDEDEGDDLDIPVERR